jgi:hypothetical protein
MAVAHFGFGMPVLIAPPVVMVEPVTLPPTATPAAASVGATGS